LQFTEKRLLFEQEDFYHSKMKHREQIYWLIQVVCWGIVASISTKYYDAIQITLISKKWYFIIIFFGGITCSHIYNLILNKKEPDTITLNQFFLYPLAGALLIGLIFMIADVSFSYVHRSFTGLILIYLDDFWTILPWFFFYHLYRYASIYQDNKKRKLEVEDMLKMSELEHLKRQLNPHFLFNALNSIKSLTISDSKHAREAITQLSDLLRLSLNLGEQKKARLGDEMKICQDYLALEKIRYEKRLNYQFHYNETDVESLIIPMVLHTLVENAIKHGIEKTKLGGQVIISSEIVEKVLILKVENSGTYQPKDKTPRGGIGLENLRKRLGIYYPNTSSFEIENGGIGVIATIKVPLEWGED
jgi:two-component system, LytTR family, sensor kinase